jgi:hypothetical protein
MDLAKVGQEVPTKMRVFKVLKDIDSLRVKESGNLTRRMRQDNYGTTAVPRTYPINSSE